ncbi:MAG: hypothetical protein E6K32_17785 [Gammaproteobacteria bacterium]|nr:MAG: hypothetical protein E6K30_06540 [Gammaproteobacteria bacterium]TLZ35267.1 MAG: hypothetical protein E6K32_17785 [Gammaproteobacteria bacterium]
MSAEAADLERFVRGESDAGNFPHREHVRMAFEMLRRHDFAETAWLYSRALRLMTARVGKPEAFNQTTTIAFLSLIAERMERGGTPDFAAFVRAHPEMLDKRALSRWYRPDQLATEIARRTFVLPEPAP